jgi:hypothetical protein
MSQVSNTKNLIERLYYQGSANNEDIQSLLIHLKEILNSNPETLRDDFLGMFPNIEISENVLSSTNIMMMMLLTHLAMKYSPTANSPAFIESRKQEEDILIQLKGAELSLRNYFQTKI